jgi:DNA-directed RNA polymerase sigma subunit (sigma70/sigma32)
LQKALNDMSRTVRIPSHRTATEEYSTKSISTPVGDDENKETYADRYLAADSTVSRRDVQDMQFDLQRAMSMLKPKQREALERFYGIGREYAQCMDQIAEEMNVTNERARQLVRQAETALASLPGIELLAQYL